MMDKRKLVVLLFQLNMLLAVFMPDAYLGIADYWYFIVFICFIGVFNLKKILPQDRTILFYLKILASLQLIASIISLFVAGKITSGYLFSYVLWIIFFFICINHRFNSEEIKKIFSGYILSDALIVLIIIVQRTDYYGSGGERFTIQILGHEKFDPNFLAAYLVFPCIICFSRLLFKFKKKDLFLFLLIIVGLLMTASRSAMLCSTLGIICCVISNGIYTKKIKNIFKYALLISFLLIVVLLFLPEATYDRLFVTSYNDGSNEKRLLDWSLGIASFLQRPILGYGMIGEMDTIMMATNQKYIAHNTFIAFLMHYGIVGTLIILGGIIGLTIKILKKKEFILFGCLISLLFSCFLISAQVAVFWWTPIILITCCIQNLYRGYNKNFIEFI